MGFCFMLLACGAAPRRARRPPPAAPAAACWCTCAGWLSTVVCTSTSCVFRLIPVCRELPFRLAPVRLFAVRARLFVFFQNNKLNCVNTAQPTTNETRNTNKRTSDNTQANATRENNLQSTTSDRSASTRLFSDGEEHMHEPDFNELRTQSEGSHKGRGWQRNASRHGRWTCPLSTPWPPSWGAGGGGRDPRTNVETWRARPPRGMHTLVGVRVRVGVRLRLRVSVRVSVRVRVQVRVRVGSPWLPTRALSLTSQR